MACGDRQLALTGAGMFQKRCRGSATMRGPNAVAEMIGSKRSRNKMLCFQADSMRRSSPNGAQASASSHQINWDHWDE